ncbi:unnamed protein product [Leptidea sinapis]|uniref:Uncharacterized protein n=1 Tax=Leptidea sinapis TaxID=189913 RepID=A0A5E4R3H9_9NEOP|nr:unnamed protein product [Leptidea sinapis]
MNETPTDFLKFCYGRDYESTACRASCRTIWGVR